MLVGVLTLPNFQINAVASRGITSSSPRLAVPASALQVNKGGFLAWLLGEKPATNLPPLFEGLPSIKLPPTLGDDLTASPTEITTLPNGLKIASENAAVHFLNVVISNSVKSQLCLL